MMTGTPLSVHGSAARNETLPEELPTVAERFADAGYRTVGVSSNPYFSPTTGTDRDFDCFDFVSGAELFKETGPKSVFSFIRNVRRFCGGFALKTQKHTPDYLINAIVPDRIESCADKFRLSFLAAHYSGVHHPYYPSPVFRKRFATDLSVSPT